MAAFTSSGGGVIRDLSVREIPSVLTTDFYATASLIGGGIYLISGYLGASPEIQVATTVVLTLILRFIAMKFDLHLPKVRALTASPSELSKKRDKK